LEKEKADKEIVKPPSVVYEFKEGKVKVDFEVFKLVYDAQLKKMLAYIALLISVFIPQIQVLLSVRQGPAALLIPLSLVLLVAQMYFSIAVITKFQEIMIMESKLNADFYKNVFYRMRPLISAYYDRLFQRILHNREKTTNDDGEKLRKVNYSISLLTYSVWAFEFLLFFGVVLEAL